MLTMLRLLFQIKLLVYFAIESSVNPQSIFFPTRQIKEKFHGGETIKRQRSWAHNSACYSWFCSAIFFTLSAGVSLFSYQITSERHKRVLADVSIFVQQQFYTDLFAQLRKTNFESIRSRDTHLRWRSPTSECRSSRRRSWSWTGSRLTIPGPSNGSAERFCRVWSRSPRRPRWRTSTCRSPRSCTACCDPPERFWRRGRGGWSAQQRKRSQPTIKRRRQDRSIDRSDTDRVPFTRAIALRPTSPDRRGLTRSITRYYRYCPMRTRIRFHRKNATSLESMTKRDTVTQKSPRRNFSCS